MKRTIRFAVVAALLLLSFQVLPATAVTSNVPGIPASVLLSIVPPKLPSDGGSYPVVFVSLADTNNLPTDALQNVTVFLSSSQTNIASVPDSVVIHAGQQYAIANLTTTSTPGTAMITAHSEGLKVQFQNVQVQTVIPSGFPSKLLVFASPSTFPSGTYVGVVRVEVVDQAGFPSKAITPVPVALTSSNSSIISLGSTSLTVATGTIFADGTFDTSASGSAVITATSTNYASGFAAVTVNKPNICVGSCGPYKLALRMVAGDNPGALPTDGQTYYALEVSLQTFSGTPVAPSSDTIVSLTSDSPSVASVQGLITVRGGTLSALAGVTTSALSGVANITATSSGLFPSTTKVQTVIPAPSKIQAYVAPPTSAYSISGSYPILFVQLQDNNGNPALARQDTSVTVSSSNSSLISSFVSVSVPKQKDYVLNHLHPAGSGKSVLTATSQDLQSTQASLTVVPSPLVMKVTLSPPASFIYANQTAFFTFSASFDGVPLQDVNVSWASSGGSLSPRGGLTGVSGTTSTIFTPGTYGSYNITANAFSSQTGLVNVRYCTTPSLCSLIVAQVPQRPPPTLIQVIIGFWYYIVAAVAVAVIAVVYLLRMRRKKQRAEIEAGFEVV